MNKYITEMIGTFFLVLVIALSASSGSVLSPLAIGSVLMVMIYMGGAISGAHYNPAVTISLTVWGEMNWGEAIRYIVAQFLGAILASCIAGTVTGKEFLPLPVAGNLWGALLVETLFTFALVIVIFNVAVSKKTSGNGFYGLAIGFTVFVGATVGGGISGGAYNPAVGLGPALVSMVQGGSIDHVWLYLVGPVLGGLLATWVFKIQTDGLIDEND